MDFEQVENAIINQLKATITNVKTIETYAGQLEQDIETLPIQFPAIYTLYAGSQYNWIDGQNQNEVCAFSVIVVAKNLRGKESLRKDTQGCYQMIQDVLTSITHKNFSLDVEKMKPINVSLLFVSKIIAAYSIDFQTNFDKLYP